MYKEVLTKITSGQKLSEQEIFDLIAAINRDEITDVQIAGKKRMGVKAFLAGFRDIETYTVTAGTSRAEIQKAQQ